MAALRRLQTPRRARILLRRTLRGARLLRRRLPLAHARQLLGGGGALRPPYDAALRRAEALLRAAEGTVPAYDVGVALGERMQLEWKWACRCAEACGT